MCHFFHLPVRLSFRQPSELTMAFSFAIEKTLSSGHEFFSYPEQQKARNYCCSMKQFYLLIIRQIMSQMTLKKINWLFFFITNWHRCNKTYVVFIHSFERKKMMHVCFLILHSKKKITMLMECSFKSGVLKLKIHMTNL